MKAMKTSHPVRGLTLRAVAASLLGMLLAGIYTQVSAVLLGESYLIAEAALPVPAMIVLVFLYMIGAIFIIGAEINAAIMKYKVKRMVIRHFRGQPFSEAPEACETLEEKRADIGG